MKKFLNKTLVIFFIFLTCSSPLCFATTNNELSTSTSSLEDISYIETLDYIENPEMGFYTRLRYDFKVDGNTLPDESKFEGNLIHLRLGIGAFSRANNGIADMELSENMLNMCNQILHKIKEHGGTAIVRFAYDNFAGQSNKEPSLDMILRHIEQLSPIFIENQDVISSIELGLFGKWGEMHSSDICTTENISKAIDAMLRSAPEKIKIAVRTPEFYAAWAKIDRNALDKDITVEGTDAYRVGIHDDGYLGSESDLGTYKDREIEIKWLENQARHTLFGGSVVENEADGEPLNTAKYFAVEGFRTHTSYINPPDNEEVMDAWKEEIYEGNDERYKGQSGYTYVTNHVGYRFVVRKSDIIDEILPSEELKINVNIENVGFANLVNDKVLSIVLVQGDDIYEIPTDIRATKWDSQSTTKLKLEKNLPEGIDFGTYDVYLRLSQYGDLSTDNNYQCIRFANENMWNEELGANYIGKFDVVEMHQEPTNPEDEDSDTPEISLSPDDENPEIDNSGNLIVNEVSSPQILPYSGGISMIYIKLLVVLLTIFCVYLYKRESK